MKNYRVAGYVKLAKLWERKRDQAIELHNTYFQERLSDIEGMLLQNVYIDITGNKHIYKRPEMVRLLRDCRDGEIDVIWSQTRAYLAPNSEEFCFFIKYIFDLPTRIDLITDDDDRKIDTIMDTEKQKDNLKKMAETYIGLEAKTYEVWRKKLEDSMNDLS